MTSKSPKAEIKYQLFTRTGDGLLKLPEDGWHDCYHNTFDSLEEATKFAEDNKIHSENLLILPIIRWNYFPE